MSRFGVHAIDEIDIVIKENVPKNTTKSKKFVWKQFGDFCKVRNYALDASTPTEKLAFILKDWGFNMRKADGSNYKEGVIKTIWNSTAKLMQEKYFNEFGRVIDPFKDLIFQSSRNARDTKRKLLQTIPENRKASSTALTHEEHQAMCNQWDEDTPVGLQKKFFHIAAVELAWRGGEAAACNIQYFKEETNNKGSPTGRIEYNPVFTKTSQGGSKPCAATKWLNTNDNTSMCPVRLYKKLIGKRGRNITITRLFLTVNGQWTPENSDKEWYKNQPIGINTIGKWTEISAKNIGLDVKNKKISNHSNRATAVSQLISGGVGEQEAIKITGHASSHSIKPYLQLNEEHHKNIIENVRSNTNSTISSSNQAQNIYNNCTIYNYYK